MAETRVFAADVLEQWVQEVLEALGIPREDAQAAAEVLVLGNLRGVDSHGVRLLLKHSEGLRDGALNPRPEMRVVGESAACAVFDGDGGLGQIVCARAMDAAIARARTSGVGAVVTRNASHCGMSAAYVLRAVKEEMIGLMLSNNKSSMAVTGGYDWTIGNNTIACGIPAADGASIVLDMTTSALTWGAVALLAAAGEELPDNSMIFRRPEGGLLRDACRAYKEGTVLPIGGHKGSGLAVVIECLTGVLSGGPFGADVSTVYLDTARREHHSQFIVAVRPEAFLPADVFKRRVSELITSIKSAPRLAEVDDILTPGEREARCTQERMRNGIPLPGSVLEGLDSLAAEVGVNPLSHDQGIS